MKCISKLQDIIDWNTKYTDIDTRRFAFRGVSDSNNRLTPKISRGEKVNGLGTIASKEMCQARMLKLKEYLNIYLPAYGIDLSHYNEPERSWRELFIAQHYGVPTSLLDFTRNPVVAAFFACSDPSKSGAIYAVCLRDQNDGTENITNIHGDSCKRFGPYDSNAHRPTFIVPPQTDKRIIAQSSIFCFTSLGNLHRPVDDKEHDTLFGPYFDEIIKLEIPGDCKKKIEDELYKIGVNASTLFPDLHGFADFVSWRLAVKYPWPEMTT